MPNIALLGSTGSIGTQALEVIERLPDCRVVSAAAGSNDERLQEQIETHNVQRAALYDKDAAQRLQRRTSVPVLGGIEGFCQLASDPDVDLVVNSIVGAAGLAPTLAALEAGKRVALANKETLVVGGHLVMGYAEQIVPIDSEHSALWQCMQGHSRSSIDALVLTASGGPFRQYHGDLEAVTVQQALRHPNWDMGGKITIDSATLMNKGLEVIEAHWLFGYSYDRIDVVVHPESIVHSLIRMTDGSYLAHLGAADMRMPIQYALTYPHFNPVLSMPLDLTELTGLHFEHPDYKRFPCLGLAFAAGRTGHSMPTVLNAANEIAVELFLDGRLGFLGIAELVETMMARHTPVENPDLETILALDRQVRDDSRRQALSLKGRLTQP